MPKEFDSCVSKVKRKGAKNPYAVCRSSMGSDKEIEMRKKKKRKAMGVRHGE